MFLVRRLVLAGLTLPVVFGAYALFVSLLVGFGAQPTEMLANNFYPIAFGWVTVWAILPQLYKFVRGVA